MLAIAVDGHQGVVTAFDCGLKCSDQASSIASILGMPDGPDRLVSSQDLWSPIFGTIIDNQHILRICSDLRQDGVEIFFFVVDRQCREESHFLVQFRSS